MRGLISNQSIKIRFLATLFANVLRMCFGFLAGIIVARGLGPEDYGNFNFLLGSFVSINALVDMGASSAFYTFLSQKKRSAAFYGYYFLWISVQFTVISMFVIFLCPQGLREKIWLGNDAGLVFKAFLASFMVSRIWQTVVHIGESIRSTIILIGRFSTRKTRQNPASAACLPGA